MVQFSIRILAASIAILMWASLPANAAPRDQSNAMWTAPAGGDMSALRYGNLTEAGSPLFNLSCFNSMSITVLDIHDDFGKLASGTPLKIELSAGDQSVKLTGSATRDPQGDDFYAEVTEFPIKAVLAVLQQSGPLTVKVNDASLTYSDLNRETALKNFQEHCTVH